MRYLSFFFVVVASFKVYGQQTATIRGTVKASDTGRPLGGASVVVEGTGTSAKTDNNGGFSLASGIQKGVLTVSYVGYTTGSETFDLSADRSYVITLVPQSKIVDEVQVIGYGQTSRRYNTGSVSTISAAAIEKQPVTNVLSALSGRMPGVFVQTTNGLPGGNINIQIRGIGSIAAGTNPLYIIDGVPFESSIGTLTGSGSSPLASSSINGAISPFNALNPSDIESISVLKDADATAIYGSRGSNGVVLITTKKGENNNTRIDIKTQYGINSVSNLPRLLSIEEYLEIRNEAFANDNRTPSSDPTSPDYAPELTVWSQSEYTNWPEFLLGRNGHVNNVMGSISGGNNNTTFTVGSNFHSESTILAGSNRYQRGGIRSNLSHNAFNQRLNINLSSVITVDNNRLSNPTYDFLGDILKAPNYPVYDETGDLNWYAINPYGEIQATSKSKTTNINSNLRASYKILRDLSISFSAGYNNISAKQTQLFPQRSLHPALINYSNFGDNSNISFILEPQINYGYTFTNSSLDVLLGGTYQNTASQGEFIRANQFSSESLMENLGSAADYSTSNSFIQYKYASVFGRATYNLDKTYLINLTVRRDGSSKFAATNRFGTFWSVGAGWLFGNERFVSSILPFLSYGKLRASYGITGNDQITPYQYLSTYRSGFIYEGISGLRPERISNPESFHWETTRKMDVAIELGFIKDRFLVNIGYFKNTSKDQLVNYPLPTASGFANYQANLPAVVENSGWEFEANTTNIQNGVFIWRSTVNVTIPKNVLRSFEGLENSSYYQTLVIGQPITRLYGYRFLNIDESSGNALYETVSGESSLAPVSSTDAFFTIGSGAPEFYGGIGNSFTYRKFQLDIFGQFAKQFIRGGLVYRPGNQLLNNYHYVVDRWQHSGDRTIIPRASTAFDRYYVNSSANIFDGSYFRVKNISFSYNLSNNWLDRNNIRSIQIQLMAQNVFTFWHRNIPVLDPESGGFTGNSRNIPPVKSYSVGLQLTF